MSVWCVLLAAGKGTRSGLKENKVFFKQNGKSILSTCISAFSASELYDGMVLVLSPNEFEDYERLVREEGRDPIVKCITAGGSERRISALNGLRQLPPDCEIVSIHDAARPFVTAKIMEQTIRDAEMYGSGIISTPVTDTIKLIDPKTESISSLDRNNLRAVQTPQTFRFNEIMRAHEEAQLLGAIVTDDAMLYEKTYGRIHLSESEDASVNIKMTLPRDFKSEDTMSRMRIGHGYDAHRLKEGRDLILCGVNVPHSRGLDGHSDADVAVHALMDAILGALGEGDIGHKFPDTDNQYKGISSLLLLERVVTIMRGKGYELVNADMTIVAQKPKLAPFIETMRKNITAVTGCECVNVKATTTEKMGFEGEEIGISSTVVVLLRQTLP